MFYYLWLLKPLRTYFPRFQRAEFIDISHYKIVEFIAISLILRSYLNLDHNDIEV